MSRFQSSHTGFVLALVASLSFGVVACGGSGVDDTQAAAAAPAPSTSATTPASNAKSRRSKFQAALPASTDNDSIPEYLNQPLSGMYMQNVGWGTGYDSVVDAPILSNNSAIADGYSIEDGPGQLVAPVTIQRIETTSDLYSSIDISASLSVKGVGWGGNAEMDWARSTKIDSRNLYLFVDASASGATKRLANVNLTPEAKSLTPEQFYQRYGDRYVSGVVLGEEIVGMFVIESQSEDQKESLSTSLGVSYGAVSFTTTMQSTLEQNHSSLNIQVSGQAIGTTPADTTNISSFLADVNAKLSTFATQPADVTTQTVRFIYSSYADLDGYPGLPANTAANVAQHQAAAEEYSLYASFANTVSTAGYDMTTPLMTDIQNHANDMQTYLTNALTTSPSLPAALPTITGEHAIESFATLDTATTGASFTVKKFHNGFMPQHLSDYDIPIGFTQNGVLGTTTFEKAQVNEPAQNPSAPVSLNFFEVSTPSMPSALAYTWDGAGVSFLLPMASQAASENAAAVQSALTAQNYTDYNTATTNTHENVLILNAATGMVLSNQSGTYQDFQTPFQAIPASGLSQLWQVSGTTDDVIRESSNYDTVFDCMDGQTAAGAQIGVWSWNGDQNQYFHVVDAGNGFRVLQPNTGGTVAVSSTCPTDNPACGTTGYLADRQPVVLAQNGIGQVAQANQLWRFIPEEWIDAN